MLATATKADDDVGDGDVVDAVIALGAAFLPGPFTGDGVLAPPGPFSIALRPAAFGVLGFTLTSPGTLRPQLAIRRMDGRQTRFEGNSVGNAKNGSVTLSRRNFGSPLYFLTGKVGVLNTATVPLDSDATFGSAGWAEVPASGSFGCCSAVSETLDCCCFCCCSSETEFSGASFSGETLAADRFRPLPTLATTFSFSFSFPFSGVSCLVVLLADAAAAAVGELFDFELEFDDVEVVEVLRPEVRVAGDLTGEVEVEAGEEVAFPLAFEALEAGGVVAVAVAEAAESSEPLDDAFVARRDDDRRAIVSC